MSTRKKSRQQGHQPQQQLPQPSDYETDAPPMEHHIRPPPRSNEELNLTVIRRHYPDTTAILSIAPYVTIYSYSEEAGTWDKQGMEGTMFVCALTPSPIGAVRFSVVILNRRGMDNFRVELLNQDMVQDDPQFLIVLEAGVAYGLWIYEEEGTNMVQITNQIILECASQAEASRKMIEERLSLEQQGGESNSGEVSVDDNEEQGSVPMGRQVSLRELFGKQREQDSEFSAKIHHSPAVKQGGFFIPPTSQMQRTGPTPFDTNPETEFFRSGRSFTPQMVVQQHARLRDKH